MDVYNENHEARHGAAGEKKMSGNNFGNVGDRRAQRDPTKDGALKARLADPIKTAAEDAAVAAEHAAIRAAQDDAIHGATRRRIEALAAQFGEWAIVADVLASEGLAGEKLALALAKCQAEAPTAAAWMRQNF